MEQIEELLFLGRRSDPRWQRYGIDAFYAIAGAGIITAFIYLLHLYPRINNISLLYLFIVWSLASTRGLYAALITSIVAFLSFDFFLVTPLYTFTIGAPEEWLALIFLLATAVTAGLVAARLRQSVQNANRREREARVLYQLVSATIGEDDVEHQLAIVARAIFAVFAPSGVRGCSILLPDEHGDLRLLESTQISHELVEASSQEETMRRLVMKEGRKVDFYDVPLLSGVSSGYATRAVVQSTTKLRTVHRYISLIPLKAMNKIVGVVRLIIEDDPHIPLTDRLFRMERKPAHVAHPAVLSTLNQGIEKIMGVRKEQALLQPSFFETFLDQTTAIIESARLRQESFQIEILQRTDALRAALLSSVSHDLRTPLSSIKVAANSLQQKDVEWDEEARQGFAATIEREADRLNRLVGNLLDMSRIEGGVLKPEKELYPFDELVHYVVDHVQFSLKDRDVCIQLPDDLPPVELDFLQMDQVLTNLFENAARYTPVRSPIEISAMLEGEHILVSVADRGPGIPVADTERIFDKFYRVSDGPRKGMMGTGLGLAVCRGIIEAHGGHIWAENREGGGAIFRFTLPVKRREGLLYG